MSKKFTEYNNLDLSQVNKEVLQRWNKEDIFRKSMEIREGAPSFVFYEGPPSANGMPGIHHVIARSIKDIFCRYKTMKGYQVKRKAGWDTHGLPVELGVEKALGITKEDIGKTISVAEYNAACRKDVMKYTKEWEDLTNKMGYWVDMDDPYITYDNRYIETLWYLLKELYNKDLLYKGYTIQPYSPAAGTGLSTHELNQPGCYRDVKDTTCVAQFRLPLTPSEGGGITETQVSSNKQKLEKAFSLSFGEGKGGAVYFLAWTTTPWTLPSNTALCVGPNIDYVAVQSYNPYTAKPMTVILAKDLIFNHFNEKAVELDLEDYKQGDKLIPFKIIATCKGSDLAGMEYEQLIPWVNPGQGAFRVITGDFVTTEDGTGIVHIAPTFGADDDRVAKANNIPPLMLIDKDGNCRPMVDLTGKFFNIEDLDADFVKGNINVDLYKEYAGRFVKNEYIPSPTPTLPKGEGGDVAANSPSLGGGQGEATTLDIDLCVMLKQQNLVFKIEKHIHNYPHCWRTDKPVLYYPLDSWFIRTTACRERMIELNNTINWKPQSTGTGRFGKWLENLQDWNLSRSRYWGTPLPIWRTEDSSEEICIGSVAELMEEIQKAVAAGVMSKNPFENFKPGDYSAENYSLNNIDLHRPYVDEIILVSASGKPMKRESDLIDVWFDSGAMPYAQNGLPRPTPTLPKGEGGKTPKFLTARPSSYHLLKEKFLENRKNPTQAEEILWETLRGKKLSGYKFRRQHQIDEFIVDFVCLSKHLVIEIDGGYHDTEEMQLTDVWRTSALNELGYTVIRFSNEEVIGDIESVLEKIHLKLSQMPLYDMASKVLPMGEDLGGASLFPADFIAEGVDQTRGWFFTLHAIATMIFDSVSFKTVVSNGLVLDKNGNKMSKRLGNAVDPFETIEKYGSDPLRWYMITNASPWDNLKFDVEGIEEARRKFFGTLYNTYSFFALYANVDGFEYKEKDIPFNERPEIDRWILSLLNTLIKEVDEHYATYEPTRAGRAINDFVNDNLSNWYVRLNRKRFWGGEMNSDKLSAYQTLYTCLETVAKLMSPIAPFYADKLFLDLTKATKHEQVTSVHLSNFPVANESMINKDLEEQMQVAQTISSMVLALRRKVNIKVRQPLSSIMVPVLDAHQKSTIEAIQGLILGEVNIKEIKYVDNADGVLVKKIKPDFKKLGPRYGKIMKDLAAQVAGMTQAQILQLEQNGQFNLQVGNESAEITLADVEIISEDIPGWLVANEGKLTVALDITITDELRKEGIARELVNRIQNIRKANGYEIVDKIKVTIQSDERINDAVTEFNTYIANQVLANSVILCSITEGTEIDFDDFKLLVKVEKV